MGYGPPVEPLLVIANADAGTADEEALEEALSVLREKCSVEVAKTSNPGELDGVLQRAASRRIVVAGGDGSLHAVIAALYRRHDLSKSTVGLIPLGTGNDFARGVDIPLEPAEAARVILEGQLRPMDVIVDELGEVVVNNVHVGVSATASRRGARWKTRLGSVGVGRVNLGKLGYPIGAALAAINPPHLRLRIEVDGSVVVDVDQPVLMVAIGNGANVGGGLEITPEADPEDGQADVMVSKSLTLRDKVGYAISLRRGTHHQDRHDVLYVRATKVSVSGESFYVSADGEIYGPERTRTWHVEPGAYSFIVPHEA